MLVLTLLVSASAASAYVGPGAGFGLATSFLALLNAILLSAASLLLWPLSALRRRRLRSGLPGRRLARRVVILGLDGLSPDVVDRLIAEGVMPRFAGLAASGTLARLATTTPGVSPVAWTSFQTGVNPGRHAIFDFLTPDRGLYCPSLSSVETVTTSRSKTVVRSLRRSRPFWAELARFGLRSAVIRVPITYPPEKLDGFLLSGMCVPDLRGTQGTYTFFCDEDGEVPGGSHRRLGSLGRGRWRGLVDGPPDSAGGCARAEVILESRRCAWSLSVGGGRTRLVPGRPSAWFPLVFRQGRRRARGIARACLTKADDSPRLYVSAVHPDPWSPPFPISHPPLYSRYLAGVAGPFATIGLAEDTWALVNGVIDRAQFEEMAWSVFRERRAMMLDALRRVGDGLVACVFDTPDRMQHVSWRLGAGEGSPVRETYRRIDALLGDVLDRLRRGDMLLVMSDHGFTSFEWCIDLNRFLLERGFLHLLPGVEPPAADLSGVDWARTRAYSMGLAGIHLNLEGREASGIVKASDAAGVMDDIARGLLSLDGPCGGPAVASVRRAGDVYNGPYTDGAPDLLIGTATGIRASWKGVTGGIGASVFEKNDLDWSGDHSCESGFVPGVIASNFRLSPGASITDIAPTVLSALGAGVPAYMEGRSLLEDGA